MANKYGIKETTEVFRAAVGIVETTDQLKNSPVEGVYKYSAYLNVVPALVVAGEGIGMVPKELSDIEPEEYQQLRAEFGDKINNPLYVELFGHLAGAVNKIAEILEQSNEETEG